MQVNKCDDKAKQIVSHILVCLTCTPACVTFMIHVCVYKCVTWFVSANKHHSMEQGITIITLLIIDMLHLIQHMSHCIKHDSVETINACFA